VLDDFRPAPFFNGELISLIECFTFRLSGIQTKRDDFVYASTISALTERISAFADGVASPQFPKFAPTDARPEALARSQPFDATRIGLVAYRPLDHRYLYNHSAFLDRSRPDLQSAWGETNVGLYAMSSGTGAGPAVWCHGLLPDYHAFRGSYGGYAFPLFDRRAGHGPFNLKASVMEALGAAYGGAVAPEAVFDVILCLLSGRSYTTRFAEDLEDTFPHIPFPAARTLFDEAAALGAEIRAVETFARLPREDRKLARAETAPTGPLAPVEWKDGEIRLCADGSGRVSHLPANVWQFAVSGYRVLPRWLAAREKLAIGRTFIPELRDVAARIAELIDLFDAADSILQRTLDEPLSRAALGIVD
jgi:hypothetical protein